MKNLLTLSIESTLRIPISRKMNIRIIPINEPGKLMLARLSKYEISTPSSAKAMMIINCLKIFMVRHPLYYRLSLAANEMAKESADKPSLITVAPCGNKH
jgi:hypothetical protein